MNSFLFSIHPVPSIHSLPSHSIHPCPIPSIHPCIHLYPVASIHPSIDPSFLIFMVRLPSYNTNLKLIPSYPSSPVPSRPIPSRLLSSPLLSSPLPSIHPSIFIPYHLIFIQLNSIHPSNSTNVKLIFKKKCSFNDMVKCHFKQMHYNVVMPKLELGGKAI